MKSIILAGAAKAGKTTLARRLSREKGLSLISGDALICTFEDIFPQLGITHEGDREIACKQFEDFIVYYINHLNDFGVAPFILDTLHLLPETVIKHNLHKKYRILYFGYPDMTAEEKLQEIRAHKCEFFDWTEEQTDEKLLGGLWEFVDWSKKMQRSCEKLGLAFIDTSHDFSGAQQRAYDLLTSS